jgi:hypothetical protein
MSVAIFIETMIQEPSHMMSIGNRFVAGLLVLAATTAWAQQAHSDKERQEDIRRHRAMAAAHEAAAQCLADGKDEKVCLQALQAACKGLAIGKYCGMRHAH